MVVRLKRSPWREVVIDEARQEIRVQQCVARRQWITPGRRRRHSLMIVRRAKAFIISPYYALSPPLLSAPFLLLRQRRANNQESVSSIELSSPAPPLRHQSSPDIDIIFPFRLKSLLRVFQARGQISFSAKELARIESSVDNTQQVIMAATLIQTANQHRLSAISYRFSIHPPPATRINSLTSFLTTSTHTVLCY